MRTALFVVIALALGTAGCDRKPPEAPPPPPAAAAPPPPAAPVPPPPPVPATAQARAELVATQGQTAKGSLVLESLGAGLGVHVHGTVEGLSPSGTHGFHIHEKGDCSAPDATSAGGHFNPDGKLHGDPAQPEHHVGDIFSVTADANGVGQVDATASRATLGDGSATDVLGRAVVLHAKADDYKTQPSGDSGDRIACGVIQ